MTDTFTIEGTTTEVPSRRRRTQLFTLFNAIHEKVSTIPDGEWLKVQFDTAEALNQFANHARRYAMVVERRGKTAYVRGKETVS